MEKDHAALLFVCPFPAWRLCFAWLIYYRLVFLCCGDFNGNVGNGGRGMAARGSKKGYISGFSPI